MKRLIICIIVSMVGCGPQTVDEIWTPGFVVFGDSRVWCGHLADNFEDNIIDHSVVGHVTWQVISDIDKVKPDIPGMDVILCAGTNDIFWGGDSNSIIANYIKIIDKLKFLGCEYIYILELLPLTAARQDERFFQISGDFNSRIANVYKDDSSVIIVKSPNMRDAGGHLREDLSWDGVHYNDAGYDILFNDFVNQIGMTWITQ